MSLLKEKLDELEALDGVETLSTLLKRAATAGAEEMKKAFIVEAIFCSDPNVLPAITKIKPEEL